MNTKKFSWAAACLLGALVSVPAFAAVKNPRVVWDNDPAHQAVISFTRNGTAASTAQVVKYGTGTDESAWQTQSAISRTFKTTVVNYIARLTNLTPDTEYFFRVCDASGCSAPHFFRSAPADDRSMTVIAGGDSRTDRTMRQRGNRLVQKIRPHFVMFSGDFTDDHTATEMDTWLTDWLLTYTPATINGIAYKQVYPLVPTVGNHEASDHLFMCSIFGIDGDANGTCTRRDTYFAFNAGTLVRVYTLNSELTSSFANDRTAQRSWLNADLPANQNATRWRFAQYHRPMFPRTSSKPASTAETVEFASPFDSFKMNLANESDSHLVKYTYPVNLSGSAYQRVDGGTVYIGEGAWGAPTRTADRHAAWGVDEDSFAHLNILSVTAAKMEIRTVYMADEAAVATLDKTSRDADPLALPSGMKLWAAGTIGTVYKLKLDAQGRTAVDTGTTTPPTDPNPPTNPNPPTGTTTLLAVRDVQVGSKGSYLNGATVTSDNSLGSQQVRALIGWDLSGLPSGTTVTAARIEINVTDASTGTHNLYNALSAWTEASAVYSNSTFTSGAKLGSIVPNANGVVAIQLNAAGLAIVRGWINGSTLNHGFVLDPDTDNGVSFTSREGGNAAKLVITH
jgi:hypothetical protein